MSEASGTSAAWFGRALRLVTRLLSVALIGLVVGVGVYALGVWTVNEIVSPLQEHGEQLAQIEDQVDKRRLEVSELEDRLADAQSAADGERARLNDQADALSERLAAVEDALAEQQAEIQNLSRLEGAMAELDQLAEGLEERLADVGEQQELDRLTVERLTARLTFMRTMVLISRADSLIARGELALAEQTLQSALQDLAALPEADDEAQLEIDSVIQRLELALAVIQSRPLVASEDLDAAWALLAGIAED